MHFVVNSLEVLDNLWVWYAEIAASAYTKWTQVTFIVFQYFLTE